MTKRVPSYPRYVQNHFSDVFIRRRGQARKSIACTRAIFSSHGNTHKHKRCRVHRCHVMERESFESQAVAKVLNKSFISIKASACAGGRKGAGGRSRICCVHIAPTCQQTQDVYFYAAACFVVREDPPVTRKLAAMCVLLLLAAWFCFRWTGKSVRTWISAS